MSLEIWLLLHYFMHRQPWTHKQGLMSFNNIHQMNNKFSNLYIYISTYSLHKHKRVWHFPLAVDCFYLQKQHSEEMNSAALMTSISWHVCTGKIPPVAKGAYYKKKKPAVWTPTSRALRFTTLHHQHKKVVIYRQDKHSNMLAYCAQIPACIITLSHNHRASSLPTQWPLLALYTQDHEIFCY